MGFLNRLVQRTLLQLKAHSLDDLQTLRLLGEWLKSDDLDRVDIAVRRLGALGNAGALEMLEAHLQRTTWFYQRTLILKLLVTAGHVLPPGRAVAALLGGRGYEWQLNVLEFAVSEMLAVAYSRNPNSVLALLRDRRLRTRRAAARALETAKWSPPTIEDEAYYLVAQHKVKKAAKLGGAARPALVNALNDLESTVERKEILALISKLQLPDTEMGLTERFYSLLEARQWDQIRRLGEDCIPLLLATVKNPSHDTSTRAEAVRLLGLWRHRDAAMVIAHLLDHESEDLVGAAVYVLGEMPPKDVVPCIVTLVRSMKSWEGAAEAGRFFQNAATVIRRMDEAGQRLLSLAIDEEKSESLPFMLLLHLQEQSQAGQGWQQRASAAPGTRQGSQPARASLSDSAQRHSVRTPPLIRRCEHCAMKVIPTADNLCPHCRRTLG